MDPGFLIVCLISCAVCGAIGYSIGDKKNLAGFGATLGLLLGPIGLIIVAILPAEPDYNEPPYSGPTSSYPAMDALSDRVAGITPRPRIVAAPAPPRFYVCEIGGEVLGPYNGAEIAQLRADGTISDTTLFCLEGTQNWTPAPKMVR
jgi:hypothetical protein